MASQARLAPNIDRCLTQELQARRILRPMRWAVFTTALLFLLPLGVAVAAELSDNEIRQILIEQSIAAYPGNCPCPYNLDRAGRKCGARSAYSKQGRYGPLCYPNDVTDEMVKKSRKT